MIVDKDLNTLGLRCPEPIMLVRKAIRELAVGQILHGLQAWLLQSTMTNQEKQQDKFKALRLFIFGVFETLSWKNKK